MFLSCWRPVYCQEINSWKQPRNPKMEMILHARVPPVQCASLDSAEEMKNHTVVETILRSTLIMISVKECWFWKNMNVIWMKKNAWDLYVPRSIISQNFLEKYVQYVMDFITSLSEQHDWLLCLISRSHFWWSSGIARTISDYQLALQRQWNPDGLLSVRCQWNFTIHHAKIINFHEFTHQIVREPHTLWKMIRWERTARYTPSESSVILSLKSLSLRLLISSFLRKIDLL